MALTKKKPKIYINNASLLKAIIEYREHLAKGDTTSSSYKKADNEIGKAYLAIATNMLRMPKFYNKYAFTDLMVGDAIWDCCKYAHNFDPDRALKEGKVPNPFSYFTQICYNAFRRRIKKEKKDYRAKQQLILQSGIIDNVDVTQESDDTIYANQYIDYLKSFVDSHSYYNPIDTAVLSETPSETVENPKANTMLDGLFE